MIHSLDVIQLERLFVMCYYRTDADVLIVLQDYMVRGLDL